MTFGHGIVGSSTTDFTVKDPLRFCFEMCVAVCLSVCFYFLVRNFALGVQNDFTNLQVFSACSHSDFHPDQVYDVWRGRLSGLVLTGSLFDGVVKDHSFSLSDYANRFGMYQAVWLFVLFVTIIAAVRDSLLVNLAVFAGLLYNFSPAGGLYFYPWDLPATVFFTLAVLLYERGRLLPMLVVVGMGCFFKETVLVCAILPLFSRQWKWRHRLLAFAGLVAFYLLGKRCLMDALHLKAAVLAMGNDARVQKLLRWDLLLSNLKMVFRLSPNHIAFANGGTLAAIFALGWKKRFRPYLWVIVLYVAGQFLYGSIGEIRIFMQVLPLSCLLLSQYFTGPAIPSRVSDGLAPSQRISDRPVELPDSDAASVVQSRGNDMSGQTNGAWAGCQTDFGLMLTAAIIVVLSGSLVVWDYGSLVSSRKSGPQSQVIASLRAGAERGEAPAQYELGDRYFSGDGVAKNQAAAVLWFQKAAEGGHRGAQLAFGLRNLQGEGTTKSYEKSVPWFEAVAAHGNEEPRYFLGLLYGEGLGVPRDMIDRFQSLADLGPVALIVAGAAAMGFFWKKRRMIAPALCLALILGLGSLAWGWCCGGLNAVWEQTFARNPADYVAHNLLGIALIHSGRADEAFNHCRLALALRPRSAEAHFNLGVVWFAKGAVAEAIAEYRKALDLRLGLFEGHRNLADALLQIGQTDEAIVQYRKVLEMQPDQAEGHCNLGYALLLGRRTDEAILHLQRALELQPDYPECQNNLGYAFMMKGQMNEAILHLQAAVRSQPNAAVSHNNLGYALLQNGQVDAAIAELREALRLKPDAADASNNLAKALSRKAASTAEPNPSTRPESNSH